MSFQQERLRAQNREAALRSREERGQRERRLQEQQEAYAEEVRQQVSALKAEVHTTMVSSIKACEALRINSASQFRETEEFLRQQMDGQRELWAEEARQRARQSAGSASRVTQARVHVREANAKLASSVVKERKALEVRMQQEGAALLELKRQLAARVRRQAGLQMVRKIKESVISERMEQANVRRAEQAEDEAVISASRAACAEEKAARRGEIVRELAVGSRRSKSAVVKRVHQLTQSSRQDMIDHETRVVEARQAELERKQAVHDAVIDSKFDLTS